MAMTMEQKPLLPLISFTGKTHLITKDSELAVFADVLKSATELGFDTETRPSFKKGESYLPALLQLATTDTAYLIRLHDIKNFEVLKEIFENEAVLKTGVAIKHDLKQLQMRFKFTAKNFVELQDLAKKKNLQNFGLQGMTEEVLAGRLSKRAKITNWEAPTLTAPQLLYAATDAWVGLVLYKKLIAD